MRIVLCGDTPGIRKLLAHVPEEHVVGIIAASIRPQYIQELNTIAKNVKIPLLIQPKWKSANYENFRLEVEKLKANLLWVNSYSMIIRDDVLSSTCLGGLNMHASLLPRNRGSNPIQWSIIAQEHGTGVTLHEMDSGLDTGPIIDHRKVPIFIEDTWLDVRSRLDTATDQLLRINVPKVLSEKWHSVSQNEQLATTGFRRRAVDGRFTWSDSVIDIHNKICALIRPLSPESERIEINKSQVPWKVTFSKYSSGLEVYSAV